MTKPADPLFHSFKAVSGKCPYIPVAYIHAYGLGRVYFLLCKVIHKLSGYHCIMLNSAIG